MVKYFKTPDGYFVNLYGPLGCLEATIHRKPVRGVSWRLCFAECTGQAKTLQGKTADFKSLRDVRAEISLHDKSLDPTKKTVEPTQHNERKWDVLGGLHMPYGN